MTDEIGHQLPNIVYPGLDRGELVEWVERFYGEYYFRPRVVWRVVRKALFDSSERRRLTKEARERWPCARSGRDSSQTSGPQRHHRRAINRNRTPRRAVIAHMFKTRIFAAVVVLSNVLGNFSLTWGMRQVGSVVSISPLPYLAALFNPWVALGVALLIVWLLSQMTLLSWADLSYVLPVTSVGYVLVALVGRFFLHEQITTGRWIGISLIMLGVALVTRTEPRAKSPAGAGGSR